MGYEKLLDNWAEIVFRKADLAMDRAEDVKVDSYKHGYCKGYSDGLRMALSTLSREEAKIRR